MSRKVAIKLLGVAASLGPSPFDNQYVKEYDPTKPGVSPWGDPMTAHLVTTPNIDDAMVLDFTKAWEVWRSVGVPETRDDGQPNRPLTAFHAAFEPVEVE